MTPSDSFPDVPAGYSPAPYIPAKTGSVVIERAYSRVSFANRLAFQQQLIERYGEEPVKRLLRLLDCWKQTSRPRRETQTYEMLVKKTFDTDAAVRCISGEPNYGKRLGVAEEILLTAYHSYSQKFLESRFGSKVPSHRGLRSKAVAELFAQALDDPGRDFYYFETNVVSNHSTVHQVATDYSDGIALRWDAERSDVVSVIDHVRPGEVPSEAEIHVQGGVLRLNRNNIYHTGIDSDFERPLYKTVERLRIPNRMELIEHQEIADLVAFMAEYDVRVGTENGGDRLDEWWTDAKKTPAFSSEFIEQFTPAVSYATTPDSDAYWLEQP